MISDKREKIMIERLKITTNYMFTIVKDNKIKMSEVHKVEEDKDKKNNEPRTHSAIYTIFSPRINIEYNNTIYNYKFNNKKRNENYNDLSSQKINSYNLKRYLQSQINNNTSKKDYNSSNIYNKTVKNSNINSDIDKNESLNSLEKKSCFHKFMNSVSERVNQIQKTVKDYKFTGLFSPIETRNIKIGPDKKSQNKKMKYKYKFKDSDNNKVIIDKKLKTKNVNKKKLTKTNSISLSKSVNNYVLINKDNTRSSGKKKTYQLMKFDIKNDSLAELFKNHKHIVQHQYTISSKNLYNIIENRQINIITNGTNDPKKIAYTEFSKKNMNIFYHEKKNKYPKFKQHKIKDFNPIDYMKIILGTRYREHEISKGQKKFSNMLTHNIETINYFSNPEFQKNINLFLNQNKYNKYNYSTMVKPTKVDLLVYNKTIENNSSVNFRNFSQEQEVKKRLCSRNVKRRTKTICLTRTLTGSAKQKY